MKGEDEWVVIGAVVAVAMVAFTLVRERILMMKLDLTVRLNDAPSEFDVKLRADGFVPSYGGVVV